MRNLTDDVVDISFSECNMRPPRQASLSIEALVNKHYGVITLPTMCTGATEKTLTYAIEAFSVMGLVPQSTVKMLPWVLELTAIRNAY